MQISGLPASSTLNAADVFAKDNSSATTEKINAQNLVDGLKELGNFVSNPVPVVQGGTGATTASAARANLGITTVSETFTVALASSITDGQIVQANYYDPIQGVVYLKIRLYSPSGLIPTANSVIATVPQKYRPSNDQQLGPALVCKTGELQPPNVEWCYISSDGTIQLNNFIYGAQTTSAFMISTMYPLI